MKCIIPLSVSIILTVSLAHAQSIEVTTTGVGIGTATPSVKLEVQDNSAIKVGKAYLSSGGATGSNFTHLANNEWNNGSSWVSTGTPGALFQQDGQNTSIFSHNGSGTHALLLKVKGNGNVGIGTGEPQALLHIKDPSAIFAPQVTLARFDYYNDRSLKLLGPDIDNMDAPFIFQTNNAIRFIIDANEALIMHSTGNIGIGTLNPTHKLTVNGQVKSKGFVTDTSGWSDYVFQKDYKLPTLAEVEMHIATKGHLLGIPSEKEVLANGINLGEMQAKLLAQVEQLTLHMIAHEKALESLKAENVQLKQELKAALK